MNISDKTTFKLLAFLLLLLIAGDSLAIFDFFKPTRFGLDSLTAFSQGVDEVDRHIPVSDSEQNPISPDPCFLCACCLSGLSLCLSCVTDYSEQPFFIIIGIESLLLTGISESTIFRPPRYLS